MDKKKKIIIICISILVILLIIITIKNLTKQKKSISDFNSVKEIIQYYQCTYISMKNSQEEGYKKDIKLTFSIDPITKEGVSNKLKYERIISSLGAKMNQQDFRIIDETKNIIIRVNFDKNGTAIYTINNDASYFSHLESQYALSNTKDEEKSNIEVNSNVLQTIIYNNWKSNNLNLGEINSTIDKYDIYFNEGYKIRKINGKVYNIVFTKQYNKEVVNGIKTSENISNIEAVLGKPTYSFQSETNIIGYKNEELYAFFSDNEISIYRNEKVEDTTKFANLVSKLIENNDSKQFISNLTDIWADYSKYENDNNRTYIRYPLKGIEIKFNIDKEDGISIYSNFKGNITNEDTLKTITERSSLPKYVYIQTNKNLVEQDEIERVNIDFRNRNPYDMVETLKTNSYIVYLKSDSCKFYSRDKTNMDFEINNQKISSIYNINDTTFVYGIKSKGIFKIDASIKQITKIIEGNENYNINKVENNIIYYDNTSIKVQ